jgi:hypothetical protein
VVSAHVPSQSQSTCIDIGDCPSKEASIDLLLESDAVECCQFKVKVKLTARSMRTEFIVDNK